MDECTNRWTDESDTDMSGRMDRWTGVLDR